MKSIQNKDRFFNLPHPFIFNRYSILIPGVVTVFIIVLLAPLQFQKMGIAQRSLFALIIGLAVSVIIFLTVFALKKFFPVFSHEDRWTIGKEACLYLLIILFINFLIFSFILILQSSKKSLLLLFGQTTFYTLCISIFPTIILILFEQYTHQKNQLAKARQLTEVLKTENNQLQIKSAERTERNGPLQFKAENGNIELQLAPDELLCLKSDGNYVEIFYLVDGRATVQLIRNKLKHLEPTLIPRDFFRCHNRFIVNGRHIIKIEGNARNLEVLVRGLDFAIPVSRAKAKSFADFLESLA